MGEIAKFYVMPHPTMIIPEMGEGEEEKITATADACAKVADEIGEIKPDTVIIVTPHGPQFSNSVAFSLEEKIYGQLKKNDETKVFLNFDINVSITNNIIKELRQEHINCVRIDGKTSEIYGLSYELDYGTIIPMYFIDKKLSDYNIVHITCGNFSKYDLYKIGMTVKKVIEESDSRAVFIASGELSHRLIEGGPYGYTPEGEKFDKEITTLLSNGDVLGIFNMEQLKIDLAGECGMIPFYSMLGAMNGNKISGELLSYEGPFGIGYGVMNFSLSESDNNTHELLLNDKNQRYQQKKNSEGVHVKLARDSLTEYLKNGNKIDLPSYVTEEMIENEAGVFIRILKYGKVIASGGSYLPRAKNIADEIIFSSIELTQVRVQQAGVSLSDLEDIDILVDVITDVEKVNKEELDPNLYGIYITSGLKNGFVFPKLPDINTSEEQIALGLKQGNISPLDDYTIERFKVSSYK